MATASNKSVKMQLLLTDITGRNWKATIEANLCIACEGDATDFADDLSRKEYTISGLCQKCQDKIWPRH